MEDFVIWMMLKFIFPQFLTKEPIYTLELMASSFPLENPANQHPLLAMVASLVRSPKKSAKKYLTVISYPSLKVNSVPISAKPTLESVLVVIFTTRNGGVPLHGWNT